MLDKGKAAKDPLCNGLEFIPNNILAIVGNPISGENFKSLLVKLVPTLEWLDGENILTFELDRKVPECYTSDSSI
ncbi:hypothetical protein GBA52_025467 [Prunus armeniaca]|nr:hypothetical protein GBA52_025467 [Prunus armeniaca]